MKKQYCKKYQNSEVLPDEENKCSLCDGNCTEEDETNELPENYWSFIEKNLPDYSSNDEVLTSGRIDCLIDDEIEDDERDKLMKRYGSIDNAKKVQQEIDTDLFIRACRGLRDNGQFKTLEDFRSTRMLADNEHMVKYYGFEIPNEKVYVYMGGFVIDVLSNGRFSVELMHTEEDFARLKDAEAFLWEEFVVGEINAKPE